MKQPQLHIGDVARLLGITPKTIRHYHKLGLVAEPERAENDYRLYSATALLQLQRIRRLQTLGLSLQEIQQIVEAENPDVHLQQILEKLRMEIMHQQEELAKRRQRIEEYLAEGATLYRVELPDPPSSTFVAMQRKLGDLTNLVAPAIAEFDQFVLGKLDGFNWEDDYHQAPWQQGAEYFAEHPEEYQALMRIGDRFLALADLPADAPEVMQWATEIANSADAAILHKLRTTPHDLNRPFAQLQTQIVAEASAELLKPAQKRFMQILDTLLDKGLSSE